MTETRQAAVIEFLSSPSAHGEAPVERVETHASIVFLAGDRALKLKRAVRYDYLDFSTPERRRASCEAELRINRRTAPSLYRGVRAVTRERDGRLALDGDGVPVDWVLEMARFDQQELLDRRAARGALDLDTMRPLAHALADLHQRAEPRRDRGGRDGMAWVIDGNAADLQAQQPDLEDRALGDALIAASRDALARHAGLLDERRDRGWVRQCHGDLHLRNIVMLDGRPTLFDGVEFNDRIACVDVLYDTAFLLMDLWRRQLPRHANAVWNGYLAEMRDLSGLAALPLFLSCRAAVRAKTSQAAARLQSGARAQELRALGREYLEAALRLLRPAGAGVIAIGGYSGSGKSAVAYQLAPDVGPVPGAVVLRSDEIRKALLGVPALSRLGPEGYSTGVSARVYRALAERAALVAGAGHAVVVDAVFAPVEEREAIARAARDCGVPFVGLWLEAPEPVRLARVAARRHDASDADEAIVRRQREADIGPLAWDRVDASGDLSSVVAQAAALVQRGLGSAQAVS